MTRHIMKPALALAALLAASAPAMAQTLDEKVNEVFANSTGWFVSLIFSPFPGTNFPYRSCRLGTGWASCTEASLSERNGSR